LNLHPTRLAEKGITCREKFMERRNENNFSHITEIDFPSTFTLIAREVVLSGCNQLGRKTKLIALIATTMRNEYCWILDENET
jgi:hypothetical protein